MAHLQEAATCLADHCKCRNDRRLESLAHGFAKSGLRWVELFKLILNRAFQRLEARLQLVIAERLNFGFVLVDGRDGRLQLFYVALVLSANKSRDDPVENLRWIHEWFRFLPVFDPAGRPCERTNTPA